MKKLAIFDFDGTLFDSIDDVVVCFNKVLTMHGLEEMTREEYISCLGGNIDEIVALVLGDNYDSQNPEEFKDTYLKLYNESEKNLTIPFPNSHEILRQLQERNVVLAINSNRLNYSLNEFVKRYFQDIDFLAIEGHDYPHPSKPDPYGVNRIMELAGVDADDAIYIGDSSKDIETAKNAGIDCVIVKWGYGSEKDFENEYVLDVIEDISQILNYF